MITRLAGDEEQRAREMLLSMVSLQPRGEALFSDRLPNRRLGFPFFQHDLTRDQWDRLVRAAVGLPGDPSSCLMASLGPGRAFDKVFRVDLYSAYPYPEMILSGWPSVFDSILCDEGAKWAIIVNSEDCAILGAVDSHGASALAAALGEFSDPALPELFNHWKEQLAQARDTSGFKRWIERHLRHAYPREAGSLMASLEG